MTKYKQYGMKCQKCKHKKICEECDIRAEREKIIIDVINNYRNAHGYSPSINDVSRELGVSKGYLHVTLTRMANKGYISYGKGKCNIMKVL